MKGTSLIYSHLQVGHVKISQNFKMADGTADRCHFRMNCGAAICRAKQ